MRADRLISILLLLQAREKMTARELALELEVSERTIYRDIEALNMAGVPLYAVAGPGGGLGLLGSYRTNLTGLNEAELRALFMAFGPAGPLETLGAGQTLRSAVRKLSASLSLNQRGAEEKVRQRFLLDGAAWSEPQAPEPHLTELERAVWEDRVVRLGYQSFLAQPIDIEMAAYGLVAKSGSWYLVGQVAGAPRVYPVRKLTHVAVTARQFARASDFDLPVFWAAWVRKIEENRRAYTVRLRVSPVLARQLGYPGGSEWVEISLEFESLEAARTRILDFGGAAEVLEPEALRRSLIDYANNIIERYQT
ncbi:MAG TPA: WYL domain-containing protein [Anaerolineaceae bacterium]